MAKHTLKILRCSHLCMKGLNDIKTSQKQLASEYDDHKDKIRDLIDDNKKLFLENQ